MTNGAGKTTVFNLLFLSPDIGFHALPGPGSGRPCPSCHSGLGIARTFQNIRLFSNLTVLDNVRSVLYRQPRMGSPRR